MLAGAQHFPGSGPSVPPAQAPSPAVSCRAQSWLHGGDTSRHPRKFPPDPPNERELCPDVGGHGWGAGISLPKPLLLLNELPVKSQAGSEPTDQSLQAAALSPGPAAARGCGCKMHAPWGVLSHMQWSRGLVCSTGLQVPSLVPMAGPIPTSQASPKQGARPSTPTPAISMEGCYSAATTELPQKWLHWWSRCGKWLCLKTRCRSTVKSHPHHGKSRD